MKTYAEYRKQVEEALSGQLRSLGEIPDILLKAMEYSLLAGGKRLRAVLLLASCRFHFCLCCAAVCLCAGNDSHIQPDSRRPACDGQR